MRKAVIAIQYGAPHFLATCNNCSWEYTDHTDKETGYKEIRKHVRESGHEIHLEKGVHTNYRLEGQTE